MSVPFLTVLSVIVHWLCINSLMYSPLCYTSRRHYITGRQKNIVGRDELAEKLGLSKWDKCDGSWMWFGQI